MPHDDSTPPSPELIVLDALKDACEMVRKYNANPEIAKAALDWETKIVSRMQKLQPEAQAATAVLPA